MSLYLSYLSVPLYYIEDYTILYGNILYYTILYYTILYYTVLYDTIVYTVLVPAGTLFLYICAFVFALLELLIS